MFQFLDFGYFYLSRSAITNSQLQSSREDINNEGMSMAYELSTENPHISLVFERVYHTRKILANSSRNHAFLKKSKASLLSCLVNGGATFYLGLAVGKSR